MRITLVRILRVLPMTATLFALFSWITTAVALASPVICTGADGKQYKADDPLGELPWNPWPLTGGDGKECTAGPSMAQQAVGDGPVVWFRDAAANVVKWSATWWTGIPSPTLTDGGGAPVGATAWLLHSLSFYTSIAMVAGVLIQAGRMALAGSHEPGRELFGGLVRFILSQSLFIAVVGITLAASQEFAQWLIKTSTDGGDFGKHLTDTLLAPGAGGGLAFVLEIILLIIIILLGLVQAGIVIFRGAALITLCAVWPTSVAARMLNERSGWYQKNTGWIVAWILYLPAAAAVYGVAFNLIGSPDATKDQGLAMLSGTLWMLGACLTLPVLIRLCVSDAEPAAGGRGAGAGLAAAGGLLIAIR